MRKAKIGGNRTRERERGRECVSAVMWWTARKKILEKKLK